ncbi:MAG: radical SAM protein [bacterium]|nr:radical SAM protein [bacterium]
MRVLFVSGNREKLPDAVIPLGILWVASSLSDRHTKSVVDLCFEDAPLEFLREQLQGFRPDLVALGMRNIQSADYSGTRDTIAYYGQLLETIRASTNAPVVMGGSGFSLMPAELMRELRPDYGISGEAEESFPALIEALAGRGDLDRIGNLHRLVDRELVSNPPAAGFLDMDALPLPDRSLVDPRHYAQYGIDSVQTKRGCPLRCEYCTYPIIEGRVGRLRAPEVVVAEFEAILRDQPDLHHVFIVDSVFNLPRPHAKAVCREMIERKVAVPWTCYANPLGFDAELAELMAAAGCAGMEVGSDSGSDRMLDTLGKGFTTEQIRALSGLAKGAGIPDCHTFLLGTPGETIEDVRRTLDFIVELDPFGAILMIWFDDCEALDPELAKQRQRLRENVLELIDERKSEFPWWSVPLLGVNYDPALFELLRKRGYHGPLWQHMRALTQPATRRRRRRSGS